MKITHEYVQHFRARVFLECLAAALPSYWERRAAAWEDARPRPGDFNGRASVDELIDRDERCRQIAEACRRHAQVLRCGEPDADYDLAVVLGALEEAA